MWIHCAIKKFAKVIPLDYDQISSWIQQHEKPEEVLDDPSTGMPSMISRMQEIAERVYPPEIAEDEDDIRESLEDDVQGIASGRYTPQEFHTYLVTDGSTDEFGEAMHNPESVVGRLIMYETKDLSMAEGAKSAIQNAAKKGDMKVKPKNGFIYIEDLAILPEAGAPGKNMMRILHVIINAIEATGKPLVAECREATSFRFFNSPIVQKTLKKRGYSVSDPIPVENFQGSGETFYTMAVIPPGKKI